MMIPRKIIPLLMMVICSSKVFAVEPLTSVVEFFSFSCAHCYNAEPNLQQVLTKTNAQYTPVIVPSDGDSIGTAMIYYAAIRKGLGWQFRNTYWKAVATGAKPNAPETIVYVLNQITNNSADILSYAKSQDIQNKISMDMQLIKKYGINSTPTFLINNQYLVDGEDYLNVYLK